MSDVAREAGVARVTVSRVLSEPDTVAPATRATVQQAIAKLGYVPNLTAGSLASSRSRIVGGIVPSLSNAWFAETIDGLSDTLAAAGYQLLLAQSRYDPAEEERAVSTLLGRRVDALVLTGTGQSPALRQHLQRVGIPVVQTWDLPTPAAGRHGVLDMAAGFSNLAAGEVAGDHLVARGCRQPGFIGADEARARLRLEGFRRAAGRQPGCAPVAAVLGSPPSTFDDGARSLRQLLVERPGLDGIFCSNDTLAIGALFECRRQGIAVPGQLAVMGFSDQAIAAASVPALTTIAVNAGKIGATAGQMVIERLQGKLSPRVPRIADLGFRIVARETA